MTLRLICPACGKPLHPSEIPLGHRLPTCANTEGHADGRPFTFLPDEDDYQELDQ